MISSQRLRTEVSLPAGLAVRCIINLIGDRVRVYSEGEVKFEDEAAPFAAPQSQACRCSRPQNDQPSSGQDDPRTSPGTFDPQAFAGILPPGEDIGAFVEEIYRART
jgi:hypothetical protein